MNRSYWDTTCQAYAWFYLDGVSMSTLLHNLYSMRFNTSFEAQAYGKLQDRAPVRGCIQLLLYPGCALRSGSLQISGATCPLGLPQDSAEGDLLSSVLLMCI